MRSQRPTTGYRGKPETVWLMPREDGHQDKYELWADGAITVCMNPTGNFRTVQHLVREPQKR
jgi:hypothetical protein